MPTVERNLTRPLHRSLPPLEQCLTSATCPPHRRRRRRRTSPAPGPAPSPAPAPAPALASAPAAIGPAKTAIPASAPASSSTPNDSSSSPLVRTIVSSSQQRARSISAGHRISSPDESEEVTGRRVRRLGFLSRHSSAFSLNPNSPYSLSRRQNSSGKTPADSNSSLLSHNPSSSAAAAAAAAAVRSFTYTVPSPVVSRARSSRVRSTADSLSRPKDRVQPLPHTLHARSLTSDTHTPATSAPPALGRPQTRARPDHLAPSPATAQHRPTRQLSQTRDLPDPAGLSHRRASASVAQHKARTSRLQHRPQSQHKLPISLSVATEAASSATDDTHPHTRLSSQQVGLQQRQYGSGRAKETSARQSQQQSDQATSAPSSHRPQSSSSTHQRPLSRQSSQQFEKLRLRHTAEVSLELPFDGTNGGHTGNATAVTAAGTDDDDDESTDRPAPPTSTAAQKKRFSSFLTDNSTAASSSSLTTSKQASGQLSSNRSSEATSALSQMMHQTSSRLLRMTEDERPFTRDFNDLFSTLMVSLPLTSHRVGVRFQKVEHTFTSDEAVTNLGSLKFSQSNRMPDPKDSTRIVTTTTTTTFSMAKEMARSVCQRFLEARFIESVDGKVDFGNKSSVWQLTPKGMYILQWFCQRNGINQRHVYSLLESPRNTMHLVILERDRETDRLTNDSATIEVIFRRFAGADGPNQRNQPSGSDSDSLDEYSTGLVGVKVAKERRYGDKIYYNAFSGKAAVDWLMDCCTVVEKRETCEIATQFIDQGLMAAAEGSTTTNGTTSSSNTSNRFQPVKSVFYYVTERGQRVVGWIASARGMNGDLGASRIRDGVSQRDSNAAMMAIICQDPALRLLFREYLRDTLCEENLSFYLDVKEFLSSYEAAKRANATPKLEAIRETLAAAYSLYNAFLAPGSPCELNIDHSLRTALATRMTRAVGDDEAMIRSLDEVARLFDQAQNSVFKLMASDSVPKFLRKPKYAAVLRERNFDAIPVAVSSPGRS